MESNQLSDVRQRLNDLRVQKGTIRDRTDALTQELLKPTVDSKTAWDRACESGLEPTYETDAKATIREELEMLEGRERFIDEAIEGGMSVEDQLNGQASVKACQTNRSAFLSALKRQLLALREVEKRILNSSAFVPTSSGTALRLARCHQPYLIKAGSGTIVTVADWWVIAGTSLSITPSSQSWR